MSRKTGLVTDKLYRRMAAIFAREGWTWTSRNGSQVPPYVPTAADIEATVHRLASHVDGGSGRAASGRIVVEGPLREERDYPGAHNTVLIEIGRL